MSEEICKNCKYHYTEEISFDYPQSCCNKTNPNHTTEEWLYCDCFEYSKNYITNLQQKVEQLEKENKRLNNIIKELEIDLECRYYGRGKYYMDSDVIGIKEVISKIKQLKEENNEK